MKYALEMKNISQNENQKYFYFLIFAMAVVTAFTFKFYLSQKNENQALRLKLMLANKERRKPKPWGRLFASQPVKTVPTKTATTDTVSTKAAATTRPVTGMAPAVQDTTIELIQNKDTETLARDMNDRMSKIKQLDLAEIGRTIQIADELILREPETYSAYKAKLIALLTREGKYNIPADDNEINNLLEDMARFDISSDQVLQKEAALISSANAEVSALEQRITETRANRTEIETQLAQLGPNSPDYRALDIRRAVLAMQEDDAIGKLETVEDQIQQGSFPPDSYVNEDVVQIPFMRMMAREDYATAADNAEAFVQQFPASPIGYFYLVLALEKMGRKDEAVDALARSRLGSADQSALLERLGRERMQDPKHFWEKLNF